MNLIENYNRLALNEFWKQVEVDYMTEESVAGLPELLKGADEHVFPKFGIDKSDKAYFICGSARLYLYPKLREAFNLKGSIGDLDMVIPDKKLWEKAGLDGGVFEPETNLNIEAFDEWDPSKAGGPYSDMKVRSNVDILRDSTEYQGYYFMSLSDVMDYKMKMNRDKEKEVVNLFGSYLNSPTTNRVSLLKKMASIIGFEETKEFISTGKVD